MTQHDSSPCDFFSILQCHAEDGRKGVYILKTGLCCANRLSLSLTWDTGAIGLWKEFRFVSSHRLRSKWHSSLRFENGQLGNSPLWRPHHCKRACCAIREHLKMSNGTPHGRKTTSSAAFGTGTTVWDMIVDTDEKYHYVKIQSRSNFLQLFLY